MYEPVFNSVLVQIDDKDAQWGTGNDESMLGKSYSKGKVIRVAGLISEQTHPLSDSAIDRLKERLEQFKGKQIMWNEGAEAGTTFEFDGKLFGMIYWWDVRGCMVNDVAEKAK
jgi:hypothetical protein